MPKAQKLKNDTQPIVINELNVRSVDRTRKDISSWRNAQLSAESLLFPNRARLYDLYDEVLLDGHLTGIISKRLDAVLNKPLFFQHLEQRITEMDNVINTNMFRELLSYILQTKLWGISGIEFIPGNHLQFAKIPRKHIKPAKGIIAYEQNGTEGIPYADLHNVWVMGDATDLGLLLKCAPYYLYKRSGMADWAQYIEIFGQPVRIIKYDSFDQQTRNEMRKLLDESGSSLSLMVPKGTDFEMRDGKFTNGDGKLQQSFINAMNDELSVLILGNTETTRSSPTSGYAQSIVHRQEQYEITKSDLVYVADMLNHPKFISILRSYGLPVQNGRFVFAKDLDMDFLSARLNIDKQIAEFVPLANEYWYSTYGIPKPPIT